MFSRAPGPIPPIIVPLLQTASLCHPRKAAFRRPRSPCTVCSCPCRAAPRTLYARLAAGLTCAPGEPEVHTHGRVVWGMITTPLPLFAQALPCPQRGPSAHCAGRVFCLRRARRRPAWGATEAAAAQLAAGGARHRAAERPHARAHPPLRGSSLSVRQSHAQATLPVMQLLLLGRT